MRWTTARLSPGMTVVLLTAALILIGVLAFLFAAARRGTEVTVEVSITPSPSPIVIVVSPTPIISTPTATPTQPPTATPTATEVPAPVPKEPTPPPTQPPAKEPTPAAPAPAKTEPPPPAVAPPPAQPPAVPAAIQPSGPGGFGNTQQDFQAAYGAPIGRTPDGLEVFPAERSQVQVAFQNGRVAVLRLVLLEDRVMPLEEARVVARRFIPTDAQPVATGTVDRPVDVFRSATLASLFDPAAFRGAEPGLFSVAYIPSGDAFSGFMIQLGRPT